MQKRLAFYLLLIYSFASCKREYKFDHITRDASINRFDYDYSDKINSAKLFCENFLKSYRDTLLANINPKFIDSFPFTHEIAVNLYISNYKEIFIDIHDSSKNSFLVKATDYPLQSDLVYGFDLFGKDSMKYPLNFAISVYHQPPSFLEVNGIVYNIVDSGTVIASKLAHFAKDSSIVSFSNTSFYDLDLDNHEILTYKTKGVAFLTPLRDLYPFEETAKKYGIKRALYDIEIKYINSEYFREVKTYDKLFPVATKIIEEHELFKNSVTNIHNTVEFKHQVSVLRSMIDSTNVRKDLADDLLSDVQHSFGILLWPYKGFSGFMINWTIINTILLATTIFLLHAIKKRIKWKPVIKAIVPPVIVGGINTFIYYKWPSNFNITYFVLPGLIFIVTFILAIILQLKVGGK